MVGNAVLKACRIIRRSLLEQAAEEINHDINDLEILEGYVCVKADPPERVLKLSDVSRKAWSHNRQLRAEGRSEYGLLSDSEHDKEKQERPTVYLFATHIAQVIVDTETGQVTVERIWASHDVGKAISPLGVKGQIQGGVMQGVGYALMEELQLDHGHLCSTSFATYLIPTVADTPEIVPVVVEVPEPSGPYGAKGLGEPTLTPVAPAIANAIADAVGIRTWQIPMTPERIWDSMMEETM